MWILDLFNLSDNNSLTILYRPNTGSTNKEPFQKDGML